MDLRAERMKLAKPEPVREMSKAATPPTRTMIKEAAILAAARELVAEFGFRDAQMSAVSERAGVALATVYRKFPSKALLMVEVVSSVSQREVDVVAGAAMGEGSATDRLSQCAGLFAQRALQGRKMAQALVTEAVEPEIEAARLKYRRKLARVFETVIEQGIRDGEFPLQDVQASAACIVGALFEGLVGPLAADSSVDDEERRIQVKAAVDFCVRGISGKPAPDIRWEN